MQENSLHVSKIVGRSLENIPSASFKISKKTFRLQTSKLLGNRRFHPQSFPCLQTYCLEFFFSLIMKDVWAMTSSEWEPHVAAKLLTNFKHLKAVSTFLLILEKKNLTYKISRKKRIVIASVEGLDHLRSNLRIIILRFTVA